MEPRSYLVLRASQNAGVVEAWSEKRLDWLPKDWREEFRADVKDAVGELAAEESGILLARFTSPVKGNFDIENVLVFNLDREWNAGAQCFDRCASAGVIIERSFEAPGRTPDGRAFLHHHRYEVVDTTLGPRLWTKGKSLARWKNAKCGSPLTWERGAHVWSWMRRADLESCERPGAAPRVFGVRLVLAGPPGELNLLVVVKLVLDGVISAFQVDDGTSQHAAIEKHARSAGLPVEEVLVLLTDGGRGILGKRRLLNVNGQMNPGDDKCVVAELRRGPPCPEWLAAGEVFEALPKSGGGVIGSAVRA